MVMSGSKPDETFGHLLRRLRERLCSASPPRLHALRLRCPESRLPRLTRSVAPAKPKPKASTAGAPTVTVTVTNSRKADLVWLLAAEPRSANWTTVLGVAKAGKKTSTKLSQASNCHVDLQGRFANGKSIDASGFNVCADKTLNLTD